MRDGEASTEPEIRVPDGYVNRRMLREMADATENDLKTLEGDQKLRAAKKGTRGWRLYTLAQVDRVRELVSERRRLRDLRENGGPMRHLPAFRDQAVPYSLEEYEAVLDAIARNVARDRIPIETKIHPAVVKNILKDHSEFVGAIFIAKPIVDTINALDLPGVGTVRTADDLLGAMKQINEEIVNGRKCLTCKDGRGRARTQCGECLRLAVEKEKKKGEAKVAALTAKLAAAETKPNGAIPITNVVTTPPVKTPPVQPPSPQNLR